MRRVLLYGCVVFATLPTAGRPSAQNAAPPAREPAEFPETWLEGRIGGSAVRVFVETAGWPKSEGLWGAYYYTRLRRPIVLEGEQRPDGTIRLYEGNPSDPPESRARLDLKFGSMVVGTWTSADGVRSVPVQLRRTKQPPPFDTAIKNPRRFSDPSWPMQLTYPEGWFLEVRDTQLVLRSPDPKDMLDDDTLECERGRGLPRVPRADEALQQFQGAFYRTPAGWRLEGNPMGNCEHGSCEVPTTRRVGTAILMSGERAHRIFNAWGYGGIGSVIEHLVIDGDEWAHCSDHLQLDSVSRIQPRPGRTAGADVLTRAR